MAWNEPGGNGNKDPWGHRKDDQGPPDLDEVVKKIQDKFRNIFGGSKHPTHGGSDGEGIGWGFIGFIFFVMLIIWSLFGFYIIQPAEQGVETRFGAYTRTTLQGLNWHFPYPIEQVQKVNVDQIRAVTHKALMLTKDENIIEMELVIQYQVRDAKDYLFNVREPDETLRQATESSLREVVGNSVMDNVLTTGRDEVAQNTKLLIQEMLDRYLAGLSVNNVNMQDAQPPAEVQESFADVIKAREDEESYKNEAKTYANKIKRQAEGTKAKLEQQAAAYKVTVVEQATGETKRFLSILAQFNKSPQIIRMRLYLEAMETVLSNSTKILVDVDKGNNVMLLPLDKLLNSSKEKLPSMPVLSTDNQPTVTAPPATTNTPIDDPRSRGSR